SRAIAKDGITINSLQPGRIHSEQIDQRVHPTPEDQERFAKANIPIGFFGDPEDMAYVAAFLCSPKARYITGQRLYVDGGLQYAI
ncbi:MAG: SDR family NAD(P)-dependent oxidoreductase, partial [Burkholderiales bacterium]